MTSFEVAQNRLRVAEITVMVSGVLFTLMLVMGLLWAMYFDVAPPFHSTMVQVLDMDGNERYAYRPGEVLNVRRDICSTRRVPVQIGRIWREVNTHNGLYGESTNSVYEKGCIEGGNIVQLPSYMPAGHYKYSVTVSYSNNAFQQDVELLPPVYIDVVR